MASTKEIEDMDSYDWVEFIDEYHCPDYWYPIDSEYDPNDDPCCGYDEVEDYDDDDESENFNDCGSGAD